MSGRGVDMRQKEIAEFFPDKIVKGRNAALEDSVRRQIVHLAETTVDEGNGNRVVFHFADHKAAGNCVDELVQLNRQRILFGNVVPGDKEKDPLFAVENNAASRPQPQRLTVKDTTADDTLGAPAVFSGVLDGI